MKHRVPYVLAACLALTALAAAPSFAAKTYKTTTTILPDKTGQGFEGKLSSPKPACLRNRLVRGQIFAGGPPHPLGNIHTDSSGHWDFKGGAEGLPPHYEVEVFVTGKSLGGGAVCEGRHEKKVFH